MEPFPPHTPVPSPSQASRGAAPCVLTVNAGSSSLKLAIFRVRDECERLWEGTADGIGDADAELVLRAAGEPARRRRVKAPNVEAGLDGLMKESPGLGGVGEFAGIGHRIVHGGERYTGPALVDDALLDELRRLSPLSPQHMSSSIALVQSVGRRWPGAPQVACFETSFHRHLPPVARRLAIPRRYGEAGIRRYGFHGLSYEFLLRALARDIGPGAARERVILAHLGHGASMAAVRDGQCIDTSMGFTPAAGLVMGRRAGDLDPGLPSYLARTEGMSPEQFHHMVHHEAGLLGVSETTSDMRQLLALEPRDARAAEAVALFCYQAKKWIGAFTAALGGLDHFVFSGGIGEHCPTIRSRICAGLDCLGLVLNEERNAAGETLVSADTSRVSVRVIPTDEERIIAETASRVLQLRPAD